jgi:acetyl-CoA/propionyl-CoA carboxylase biotin carboxyl carrier protein
VFQRVLIANRGEIACRVIATLHQHDIRAVAVYSDADAQALHVQQADDALPIGPAEPKSSYLNIEAILDAARRSGAEAIHPGYGFLSESPEFARAVEEAGLTFIGPTPQQAEQFGDKRPSREVAKAAGVPVVPGVEESDGGALKRAAIELGYPVIVKAALGGGGKGMQIVTSETELAAAVETAGRIGSAAFGDDSVYLEKALEHPRHIEVQILGDGKGNAVHLFERECSLQRHHQKVIEETPSPGIDENTRQRLCEAAVGLARHVSYRGAGTVEFLVTADGSFYFLEVNTRLQVEHPVTELVTGLDLVWCQLRIAAEQKLPLAQDDVARSGHAIETRVYAENPAAGFLPRAGHLSLVSWPRRPFARVDAGVETGSEIPVHYDPILAKIICWGPDRETAFERLSGALDDTVVHGVTTNLNLLRGLAVDEDVRRGVFDTLYLEERFLSPFLEQETVGVSTLALASAAIALELGHGKRNATTTAAANGLQSASDPFVDLGSWRLPGLGPR